MYTAYVGTPHYFLEKNPRISVVRPKHTVLNEFPLKNDATVNEYLKVTANVVHMEISTINKYKVVPTRESYYGEHICVCIIL